MTAHKKKKKRGAVNRLYKCIAKSIAFLSGFNYNDYEHPVGDQDIWFEWDSNKEQQNIDKYGISFSVAKRVFDDENRIERFDKKHSELEERYLTIGAVNGFLMILTVIYTEKSENVIRIISARRATRQEEDEYYGNY